MGFVCFVLFVIYIYDVVRLHGKIKSREAEIKSLKEEREVLRSMVYHVGKKTINVTTTTLQDGENIEKEMRQKYTLLGGYFDDLFPWFHKEIKDSLDTITNTALKKQVPQIAVLYAVLFAQATEQLKYGEWYVHRGMLSMRGGEMYLFWKNVLGKLEQYKYFPAEDFPRMRKEMEEWIKTNG